MTLYVARGEQILLFLLAHINRKICPLEQSGYFIGLYSIIHMSIFCIQNVIASTLFKNRKIHSICVFGVPIEKLLLKSNWKNSSLKINLQSFYDRCKSCLNICRGCSLILFKVTRQVSLIFFGIFSRHDLSA